MEILISRRKMLKATAGAGVLALLASCKKSQTQTNFPTDNKEDPGLEACLPQDNLNQDQQAIRKNLRYVDQTPVSARTCDNCRLYTLPRDNNICGGCQIVPGPIHPKGYCISWLARM